MTNRVCMYVCDCSAAPSPKASGGGDLFSAIAAGVGGLRKTGGPGAGAGSSATTTSAQPARTFNAPAAAKSPTSPTSPANSSTVAASATRTPVSSVSTNKAAASSVTSPTASNSSSSSSSRSTAQSSSAASPTSPNQDHGWQELMTPEGIPYYHNKLTNVTTWEKPDALKTDNEREKPGQWVWAPDPVEAFVPARKLESFFDGRVEVEKENGQRLTIAKGVVLDELTWSSLRRPVRDLVMLDVMNQPLILHNLKHRFLNNEIYTVGTIQHSYHFTHTCIKLVCYVLFYLCVLIDMYCCWICVMYVNMIMDV